MGEKKKMREKRGFIIAIDGSMEGWAAATAGRGAAEGHAYVHGRAR